MDETITWTHWMNTFAPGVAFPAKVLRRSRWRKWCLLPSFKILYRDHTNMFTIDWVYGGTILKMAD